MTPATTLSVTPEPVRLVIDWSASSVVTAGERQRLLQWVRSHPSRQSLHVYLRQSPQRRTIQSALQALGCRVTAVSDFGSAT